MRLTTVKCALGGEIVKFGGNKNTRPQNVKGSKTNSKMFVCKLEEHCVVFSGSLSCLVLLLRDERKLCKPLLSQTEREL